MTPNRYAEPFKCGTDSNFYVSKKWFIQTSASSSLIETYYDFLAD